MSSGFSQFAELSRRFSMFRGLPRNEATLSRLARSGGRFAGLRCRSLLAGVAAAVVILAAERNPAEASYCGSYVISNGPGNGASGGSTSDMTAHGGHSMARWQVTTSCADTLRTRLLRRAAPYARIASRAEREAAGPGAFPASRDGVAPARCPLTSLCRVGAASRRLSAAARPAAGIDAILICVFAPRLHRRESVSRGLGVGACAIACPWRHAAQICHLRRPSSARVANGRCPLRRDLA